MKTLVILLILWSHYAMNGQHDSVSISQIEILSKDYRNDIESSITITNQATSSEIGQNLISQANIFIKNYGPGSLATTSIRGGSSGHTLVLWNGLPLQSPLLGLLDFSLIPTQIGETVRLIKGGNSTLWGSGAIAGIVDITNRPIDDYSLKSVSSLGSFGYKKQDLSLNFGNQKFRSTTKISHVSGDRDFTFTVSENLPPRKQSNANYYRNHLQQDFYYRPNKRNIIEAHLWIHDSSTEIPALTTQTRSEAYQEDTAFRALVAYKYVGESQIWNAKIGHIGDHNDYYDPLVGLSSFNHYSTTMFDLSTHRMVGDHSFLLGGTYNNTTVSDKSISENRVSIFTSYAIEKNDFSFKVSGRQQLIDGNTIPFMPSFLLSFKLKKLLSIKAKISRNYRAPTLNDKYWDIVGDPNLLPELGWSEELGLEGKSSCRNYTFHWNSTLYHRLIKNWIMWTPLAEGSFWAPQNINEVRSMGLENSIMLSYQAGKIISHFRLAYDLTSSTFQNTMVLPSVKKGDQLFYTPKHQVSLSGHLDVYGFSAKYHHRWFDMTTGINEIIDSSQLGDFTIGWKYEIGQILTQLDFSIENIWNSNYYIVERRPTPGRNYKIAISIKY